MFVTLFRALLNVFKKPTELYLREGTILLNGCTISAAEIKVIKKMGYFRPVIGILARRAWGRGYPKQS
jgi:hypothetical protein